MVRSLSLPQEEGRRQVLVANTARLMSAFETPFSTVLPQNECFYIKCQASFQKKGPALTEKPKRTKPEKKRFGLTLDSQKFKKKNQAGLFWFPDFFLFSLGKPSTLDLTEKERGKTNPWQIEGGKYSYLTFKWETSSPKDKQDAHPAPGVAFQHPRTPTKPL